MEKKLHLGCGRTILPDWINLDFVEGPGVDVIANLDKCEDIPLPFEDNSIDTIYGSHLLEHIRNPLPLMQELHRIAKPNAKAEFRLPYGSSDDAFEDPTHVRQYFLNSFGYFSQPFYWRADYGYRGDWITESTILLVNKALCNDLSDQELFQRIKHERNIVSEMVVTIKAIKPIRAASKNLQTNPNILISRID